MWVDASVLSNNGTTVAIVFDHEPAYAPAVEFMPCVSSGNQIACGYAAAGTAVKNITHDGVELAVQSAGGATWAAGWRWASKTATSSWAVAAIGACMGAKSSLPNNLKPYCSNIATTRNTTAATSNATSAAVVAAAAAVNSGISLGVAALHARHAAWWADYWPESFVSLPTTRIEGYYYTEMYRFASSDRVGLHGLMGDFGPSGMFDLCTSK